MSSVARLLPALLAFLPPAAFAADSCEGVFEPIRSEIKHVFRMEVSCRQLEAAAESLPVRAISPALGSWEYAGEADIRDEFWRRWQIRFSTGIVPLGVIERDAPEGPGMVVVFGLEMARRAWGLLAITQHEGKIPPAGPAAVLGEGALYDWIGVYRKEPGKGLIPEGRWLKLESGGAWSSTRAAPTAEARACLPCRGWLCPKEPIACFSDLNLNGREEALFIDDCQPYACGQRVLEPDEKGTLEVLLNEPGVYGQWTRRREGWVLVSEVFCPWGEFCGEGDASLGNPNCERPDVYRFAKSGKLKADAELRDEYFPIENRRAPAACGIDDPAGVVVYTKENRFVRYLAPESRLHSPLR